MSASHTPSPGQTPTGPAAISGAMPAFMRRRKQGTNPLVKKKLPQQRTSARPLPPNPLSNGRLGSHDTQQRPAGVAQIPASAPNTGLVVSQEEYVDYPIITTKREMLEGLRSHVMRFLPNSSAQVKHVNPMDEEQFVRPVKLHRRDPRTENSLRWQAGSGENVADDGKADKMDDKERERMEILRADRRAEREANQAQIAPVAKTIPASKKNNFQKKTEQVFQIGDNAGKKKALQLRYEEALPWHVEDFDSKNIWAGTYESALSDCHIMLIPETEAGSTQFRMVPVEKWYKFTAKNLFKALSIDEAEARMSKKIKDPRWFMDTQKENQLKQRQDVLRKAGSKLFTRTGERGERRTKNEDDEGDEEKPDVALDADDIDYNYDEAFADDEENVLFGGDDEENKEAEEKIKREQREANIFELKEEKDYDKEEEDKKQKAQADKKLAKRTQKALMKREKNFVYEDDSEGNPYSSESESEDSETERQREEERKKAEEIAQQEKAKADKSTPADKVPSAPSSIKGSSTPNRSEKKAVGSDPLARKGILKRPGSPNLSEASGSETSRKKLKKKHISSSTVDPSSNNSIGASISRPHSPNSTSTSSRPIPRIAGSTSETETSDRRLHTSNNALKIRLGAGSRPTSPDNSRAGSPAPGAISAPAVALPTVEEIRARIPAEGIGLQEFMKPYPHAVKAHPEFGGLIKANSRFDKASKILYPKELK